MVCADCAACDSCVIRLSRDASLANEDGHAMSALLSNGLEAGSKLHLTLDIIILLAVDLYIPVR